MMPSNAKAASGTNAAASRTNFQNRKNSTTLRFNLTSADLQKLKDSYVAPDVAMAAGLFRVSDSEGREYVLAAKKKGNFSGIIFPYNWPGAPQPRSYRLRRDHPELEEKPDGSLKEKNKYLSAPGEQNRLYFAPSVQPERLKEAATPIVIVEGEKKTLALQTFFDQRNEPTLVVGLSGVWNWRGTIGKQRDANGHTLADVKGTIPDVGRIEWKERKVEILFDTNADANSSVRSARHKLAEDLTQRGAQVRILKLPADLIARGINGVDDWLGHDGAEVVTNWLKQARSQAAATGQKTAIGGAIFDVTDKGVFALDAETGEREFVCSPLYIEADTRDEQGQNWGRLLRLIDRDGREHRWAMPMPLLSGDGREYRQELLFRGLVIGSSKKARSLLEQYLSSTRPERKALCVSRTGWHNGIYILPDESIGSDDGEEILFQSTEAGNHLFTVSGTVEEWRTEIASYCQGNSRLVFAVSVAFAAALLNVIEAEGGGFHFRASSSKGKTTAQLVAGSVWGGGTDKGFLRRWRATINGLESVAFAHNDALLCLDELAEVDAKDAGECAYMLANGQGKLRQTRGITLRRSLEWRTIFISSGEISLADHMAQSGKRARGGQEVRLVDIEADAGIGHGLFEDLHSFTTADEMARHLQTAAKKFYGAVIREFLRQIISEREEIKKQYRDFSEAFLKDNLPETGSGEIVRVAHRFALVAYAGMLASEFGLTGWPDGEEVRAASLLFKAWLQRRGISGTDEEAAIRQVRLFIEKHGAARFQRLRDSEEGESEAEDKRLLNRAGFITPNEDDQVDYYYILPEVFRTEVCAGFDPQTVARLLEKRGLLLGQSGKLQFQIRTPEGRIRTYALSAKILE